MSDNEHRAILALYESLLEAGYTTDEAVARICLSGGYSPREVYEALGL